jgi:hypothetical protein
MKEVDFGSRVDFIFIDNNKKLQLPSKQRVRIELSDEIRESFSV